MVLAEFGADRERLVSLIDRLITPEGAVLTAGTGLYPQSGKGSEKQP